MQCNPQEITLGDHAQECLAAPRSPDKPAKTGSWRPVEASNDHDDVFVVSEKNPYPPPRCQRRVKVFVLPIANASQAHLRARYEIGGPLKKSLPNSLFSFETKNTRHLQITPSSGGDPDLRHYLVLHFDADMLPELGEPFH